MVAHSTNSPKQYRDALEAGALHRVCHGMPLPRCAFDASPAEQNRRQARSSARRAKQDECWTFDTFQSVRNVGRSFEG
jgi:hypothetical protein